MILIILGSGNFDQIFWSASTLEAFQRRPEMDLFQTMETRKSSRAFLPQPPSHELIQEILAWAGKAPSAINIQPWEFVVIGGKEKKRLSDRLVQAHREKQVSCGPGTSQALPEPWIQRRRTLPIWPGGPDSPILWGRNPGGVVVYMLVTSCLSDAFPDPFALCPGMALGYLVWPQPEPGDPPLD
jgi:hypothetical protein